MPHNITKELKENMSSFKTKTIALIASSLIVAVAGLSFATTPAFAQRGTDGFTAASKKSIPAKTAAAPKSVVAITPPKRPTTVKTKPWSVR